MFRPEPGLSFLLFFPPSSGTASCVWITGTVMWCLHLTRPCCVALGRVLIWVVSPDWFEELVNWVSSFPSRVQCFSEGEITIIQAIAWIQDNYSDYHFNTGLPSAVQAAACCYKLINWMSEFRSPLHVLPFWSGAVKKHSRLLFYLTNNDMDIMCYS